MSDETIIFDAKGLDSLLRALKDPPSVRVGILGGNKNSRNQKGEKGAPTNAEIGAVHEFGGAKMPMRSFLRVPIADKLQEYLELSRAFDDDVTKKVIKEGKITEWLKKLGVVAERIVSDAFDSQGFGRWKPSNMVHKENHQTLVETQQLRNSITSEVK